jgi:hypothetical protein
MDGEGHLVMLSCSVARIRAIIAIRLILAGCVIGLWPACDFAEQPAGEGTTVFRENVQPILTGKCLACHGSDKKKGKLDLTRRATVLVGGQSGPAIVPGKPADSLLLQRLSTGEMPPQNPLSQEQIAAFKKWIEAGAPYENEPLAASLQRAGPDWWSLQRLKRPPIPAVIEMQRVRTPIDAFILAKLEQHGLGLSPEADRATLIRRATFDLLGLPPTPEEIEAFLDDPDPNAYERLIDRLLASPHYGERWARHWLDVVRFAESHGYETNALRPNAWPYRDYVIRAFNEDIAYPQFMLEQLAGDTVPGADFLARSATGFLVGGSHDMVGNQTMEGMLQQRMDDLDDMITATGATFLGLTVNCCRCHDHKFDPLTQRDYYSMQALFAGVQHAERDIPAADAEVRRSEASLVEAELRHIERRLDALEPVAQLELISPRRPAVNARRNVERFAPVAARSVRFTVAATSDGIEPCIDELEIYAAEDPHGNIALASLGAKTSASGTYPNSTIHRLEHLNDGRYGNSRSWISNEMGKGWVQVELPRITRIDRIVWGRDREERYKDRLAVTYRIEVALEPGQWQVIASSGDRIAYRTAATPVAAPARSPETQREQATLAERRDRLQERLAGLRPVIPVYAGTFTQPGPTHALLRGDPMRTGEAVTPSGLTVVQPPLVLDARAPESGRRLALARWLSDPVNPLPARVMVNRLWHYHFGQGIVSTPSDFGYNGDRPSHPELLDWLASDFVRGGWRLKRLHRQMMLSAAYRQSSHTNAKALEIDRQNRLLWRTNPRRLEAEAVRDAVLSVSAKLDQRMGGPGYNLWEKNTNYVVVFKPKGALGPEEFRRMIYQFKPRSQQDPTFGIFDCPDAALAKPKRTVSTTALQALNLLNSGFMVRQSEWFAERLVREAGHEPGRQVERAFWLALGRKPQSRERRLAIALIQRDGLQAFCRALFNANEFVYLD